MERVHVCDAVEPVGHLVLVVVEVAVTRGLVGQAIAPVDIDNVKAGLLRLAQHLVMLLPDADVLVVETLAVLVHAQGHGAADACLARAHARIAERVHLGADPDGHELAVANGALDGAGVDGEHGLPGGLGATNELVVLVHVRREDLAHDLGARAELAEAARGENDALGGVYLRVSARLVHADGAHNGARLVGQELLSGGGEEELDTLFLGLCLVELAELHPRRGLELLERVFLEVDAAQEGLELVLRGVMLLEGRVVVEGHVLFDEVVGHGAVPVERLARMIGPQADKWHVHAAVAAALVLVHDGGRVYLDAEVESEGAVYDAASEAVDLNLGILLQHDDLGAGLCRRTGRAQTSEACADDENVAVLGLGDVGLGDFGGLPKGREVAGHNLKRLGLRLIGKRDGRATGHGDCRSGGSGCLDEVSTVKRCTHVVPLLSITF